MYGINEDRTIKVEYTNDVWRISLNSINIGFNVYSDDEEPEFKTLFSIKGDFSKTKREKEDALAYMRALGVLSYLDGRAANVVFGDGIAEHDRAAFLTGHYRGISDISGAVGKYQKNHEIGRSAARKISGRIVKKYPVLGEFRDIIRQTLRKGKK